MHMAAGERQEMLSVSVERVGARQSNRWAHAQCNRHALGSAVGMVIILLVSSAAHAQAKGVSPGSFRYKFHETVPLISADGFSAEFRRVPDVAKLFNSPTVDQAGTHTDMSLTSVFSISGTQALFNGSEVPSDILIDLPPGVVANLGAFSECRFGAFENTVHGNAGPRCSPASQVGVVGAVFGGLLPDRAYPLYKVSTNSGSIATFGFPYELFTERVGVVMHADLRTHSDYGITLKRRSVLNSFVPAPFITFWGTPADPTHDSERWDPDQEDWGAALDGPSAPLIANASDCGSGILEAKLRMRYWSEPERWLPSDIEDFAYRFFVPEPRGCEMLSFDPSFELSSSTSDPDSPAGLNLNLELHRSHAPDSLEAPPLRKATLTLPEGMSINLATAGGLAGCTPEQIGLQGTEFPLPNPIRFSPGGARCPDASKIGVGVVDTPLVDESAEAAIYLATPYKNPFQSLLALYLVVESQAFTIKLAARVDVDQQTGQLTTTFDWLPQLALEKIRLSLFEGPWASLATPMACGEHTAESRFAPWSSPLSGLPTVVQNHLTFKALSGGTSCQGVGAPSFSPAIGAGVKDPVAAGSSPFVLRVERPEGHQELRTMTMKLPRGLVASMQNAELCTEAEIARAKARDVPEGGMLELSDHSCPAGSRVGSLLVRAGPGSTSLFIGGVVYLAGPYRGSPFSLVVVTPLVAGGTEDDPLFDLGTIVTRVALKVDPRTAQVSAVSDPIPQAIAGIPLRIKDIRLRLDRPGFIRNSSSCDEMKMEAVIEASDGRQVKRINRFQLAGCQRLGFRPQLRVRLAGTSRPGQHPRLRAILTSMPGDAGIARARLSLPRSVALDRTRFEAACVATQLAQHSCPPHSTYGYVTAWSSLLERPLQGSISLMPTDKGPPDLMLALDGQLSLTAVGKIRLKGRRAQLVFAGLPDVPVSKLVISLHGGRKGLLVNRRDLCIRRSYFSSRFVSHNGKEESRRSVLSGACGVRKRHLAIHLRDLSQTKGGSSAFRGR